MNIHTPEIDQFKVKQMYKVLLITEHTFVYNMHVIIAGQRGCGIAYIVPNIDLYKYIVKYVIWF